MNSDERKAVGRAHQIIERVLDQGEKSDRRHPPVELMPVGEILGHLHSVRSHLSAAVRLPQQEGEVDQGEKSGVWSNHGRRVVVIEQGSEGFVEVGGEVVKVLVAPKAPKLGSRVLKAIAQRARRPKMSAKAEAAMWKAYWAEQDRAQ